ncbi:choice-of-anchor tandem repeat GloVer-containing protein [Chenggangzhangella methanolivorans]|uniref:Uncharacterized protein n=1 Tax=Chenggangzhangella methanolivorans TaxID=1437009 RepID=A0A9E6R6W7_9HYPH|nr:choice-of-anchor tandem repeat GloVer-containing protein [Chenggangzhangella methanolivorans]QZN99332.1 hypothetical protein K6K41_21510 [Chenggangzhangella methanolivorans]
MAAIRRRVGRLSALSGALAAALTTAILGFAGAASAAPELTTLFAFTDGVTGEHPWAAPILGPDGALYGVTIDGGASDDGVVYRLTPQEAGKPWKYKALHEFRGGRDGADPIAGLAMGPSGALYGVTSAGGGGECSGGCGVVYELAPKGDGSFAYDVIYRFKRVADGVRSSSRLVMDDDGALYGTTAAGGAYDRGTAFSLRKAKSGWKKKILHSFAGGKDDGRFPDAGVVFGPDGMLYGTTRVGGAVSGDRGTVYRLARSSASGLWKAKLLHRFTGGPDGEQPTGPLAFDRDGALYGATSLAAAEPASADAGRCSASPCAPRRAGGRRRSTASRAARATAPLRAPALWPTAQARSGARRPAAGRTRRSA